MATAVFSSPIKRVSGTTVSMTTTAQHLAILPGYHEIKHYAGSAYRLGLAPKILSVLFATTKTVASATYTDYTAYVTDKVSTTHMPLDAMAATNAVYIGFTEMPRGVYFDVDTANAEAATLDVEYYTGSAWADVAGDSDGTDSPGATLSKDGLYSWTLPASEKTTVNGITAHWIRFNPSASLSATVDVVEIIPACIDVNYGYFEAGVEYQYSLNTVEVGAIETDMAAGSATLNVTFIRH